MMKASRKSRKKKKNKKTTRITPLKRPRISSASASRNELGRELHDSRAKIIILCSLLIGELELEQPTRVLPFSNLTALPFLTSNAFSASDVLLKPVQASRMSPKANTKRKRDLNAAATDELPAKRTHRPAPSDFSKPIQTQLKCAPKNKTVNSPPTQALDILVFGQSEFGEAGMGHKDGEANGLTRPVLNKILSNPNTDVVQIAVGGMHGLALTKDGRVLSWGVNDNGSLGRDTDDGDVDDDTGINVLEGTPGLVDISAIPSDSLITSIAAGDSVSYFVTDDGCVYGCGTYAGNQGQMGFSKDIQKQAKPMKIPLLKSITKVVCGANHSLALDKTGDVWTWGAGQQGQLARRMIERHIMEGLIPSRALQRKKIVDISAGENHSFAIAANGHVWTWGLNNYAQCGVAEGAGGDNAYINVPVRSTILSNAHLKQIAAGTHHSIGITHDGRTLVWGRCTDGQMGVDMEAFSETTYNDDSGKLAFVLEPIVVPGIKARSVDAGSDTSFAIGEDGVGWAWGFGDSHRLGLGSTATVPIARQLGGKALEERGNKLCWVGTGGQFSMIAGERL